MVGALDGGAVDLAVGSSYDWMPRCAARPGRDSSRLDLLASSPEPPRIRELPYSLRDRQHGESKLDTRVAREYGMLPLIQYEHYPFPDFTASTGS
jgi:hypothetical protein